MKKIYYVLISLVLLFIISITIFALSNKKEIVYTYDETIINNNFEYFQLGNSIESTYYYSDSYFKDSSDLENEHLRTFALSLSLAFNPTNKKDTVNYNLDNMLEELKFKDISYYDLEKFNKDTIGTSISHKKLNEKYDLVLVVLRGAGYSEEWDSNLDVGKSGNAKGFDESSQIVLSRLNEYLEKNKIKDYKLLVTGYSRAGAISGLVGVHINNDLSKYNIQEDNLFVYSFESPRYSNEEKIYDNIHNVINKNDIVTYVYPESWGLYHSGKDEDITTESSNILEKYLDILSSEKIKDNEEIDKQKFIKKIINILPKERKSFDEISTNIIDLYKIIISKTSNEKKEIINFFKNINLDLGNSFTLLQLIGSSDESTTKKAFDSLMSNYDDKYSKISNVLSNDEYTRMKEDLFKIYYFLHPSLKEDYKSNKMFVMFLTFAYNTDKLLEEHYFSTNLEQVQKKDSYFNINAE